MTSLLVFEEGEDYIVDNEDRLPYELIANLGHGHSGNVEKVRDKNTNGIFARKTIQIPPGRAKKEKEQIFRNEIALIHKFDAHPHFIQVFATYMTKYQFGLILQPVADRGDLARYLAVFLETMEEAGPQAQHSPEVTQVHQFFERAFGCLSSGLAYMRSQKIRHKDIKPQNILVHQGSVIFTDFGYSIDTSLLTNSATEGRPNFLTPRYSAPEIHDYDRRDSRSDVWSLGCVFVEILSALTRSFDIPQNDFADTIEMVHGSMRQARPPDRLSPVFQKAIEMTARESSSRPSAHSVSQVLLQLDFGCARCRGSGSPAPTTPDANVINTKTSSNDLAPPISQFGEYHTMNSSVGIGFESLDHTDRREIPVQSHIDVRSVLLPHAITLAPGKDKSAEVARQAEAVFLGWEFSFEHQRYFRRNKDPNGHPPYEWAYLAEGSRQSEADSRTADNVHQESKPERFTIPHLEAQNIQHEVPFVDGFELDAQYRVRSRAEAHDFWRVGRVFATLWAETASDAFLQSSSGGSPNYAMSTGGHGQSVYSVIRRFVVMRVHRQSHFVYACAISTYGRRGVLKPSVIASEHSIVYLHGTEPRRFSGEFEKGLTKQPIMVYPTEPTEIMDPSARLRFGKTISIDWNVKARDIGMVQDLQTLRRYWQEEQDRGFDADDEVDAQSYFRPSPSISVRQGAMSQGQSQPEYRPI